MNDLDQKRYERAVKDTSAFLTSDEDPQLKIQVLGGMVLQQIETISHLMEMHSQLSDLVVRMAESLNVMALTVFPPGTTENLINFVSVNSNEIT